MARCGGEADHGGGQARSGGDDPRIGGEILRTRADMRADARRTFAVQGQYVAIARGFLLDENRVRALGHGRAGEDAHGLARSHSAGESRGRRRSRR